MNGFLIGTIGHVDHGKTSLIKALTGINTDRLSQEADRGISIVNGYAYLSFEDNIISIIDMPGHERFVKNLLSGITGVQFLLVVVAADEGIMPQTIEHLEIAKLLGINKGAFIITKTDIVDSEMIEIVDMELQEYKENTIFEHFPVLKASSRTKEGLSEIVEYIFSQYKTYFEESSYYPRLFVDRVFNEVGVGRILTGSLEGGSIHKNMNITMYPSMLDYKIRSLHVHGKAVEEAHMNSRVAVTLQGEKVENLKRGVVLATKDKYYPTDEILIEYTSLKDFDSLMISGDIYKFYFGSVEVMGKLYILNEKYAYIKLDKPIFAYYSQKAIIRTLSPVYTVGGLSVVDTNPLKGRKLKKKSGEFLTKNTDRAEYLSWKHRYTLLKQDIERSVLKKEEELDRYIDENFICVFDKFYFTLESSNRIAEEMKEYIRIMIDEKPLRSYFDKEAFRSRFYNAITKENFEALFDLNSVNKFVTLDSYKIIPLNHSITLNSKQISLKNDIIDILREKNINTKDSAANFDSEILDYLVHNKEVIVINNEIVCLAEVLDDFEKYIVETIQNNGFLSIDDIREKYPDVSRKIIISYLEYFDNINLTYREGNHRKLRS